MPISLTTFAPLSGNIALSLLDANFTNITAMLNPLTTQGAIAFVDTGGLLFAQDPSNLFWDKTGHNLGIGTASFGTNAAKTLAIGQSTAPTTSPANQVAVYGAQVSGAGTMGLAVRDEVGSTMQFGGYNAGSAQFQLTASGGNQVYFAYDSGSTRMLIGSNQSFPVAITPNNVLGIFVNDSRNVGLGGVSAFGTSAARVVGLSSSSTDPTTAPASMIQLWSKNRNGANTAALFVRTEDSGITESALGLLVQAADFSEHTTTSTSSVDLVTLTVNIPAGDMFVIAGLIRKTAGAAASASIGVKINGTQIIANNVFFTAINQAEDGWFYLQEWGFAGGIANYNHVMGRLSSATWPAGGTGAASTTGSSTFSLAAVLPNAPITSVTITGLVGNAAVTLAVKNFTVWRLAKA